MTLLFCFLVFIYADWGNWILIWLLVEVSVGGFWKL